MIHRIQVKKVLQNPDGQIPDSPGQVDEDITAHHAVIQMIQILGTVFIEGSDSSGRGHRIPDIQSPDGQTSQIRVGKQHKGYEKNCS